MNPVGATGRGDHGGSRPEEKGNKKGKAARETEGLLQLGVGEAGEGVRGTDLRLTGRRV